MFLVLCGNSNLDVLINFVLVKIKCTPSIGKGDAKEVTSCQVLEDVPVMTELVMGWVEDHLS